MNFDESKQKFIQRCMAANLSHETVYQYLKVLKRFKNFLDEKKILMVEETTSEDIREHLIDLGKSMQPVSVKVHFMAIRCFFNFLEKAKVIEHNPITAVEAPKVPKKVIQAFTEGQVEQILSSFDKTTFVGYRNYALTMLFLGTGLRRSEAARLMLTDINFDDNSIEIWGKGSKQRKIYMTSTLRKIIVEYLKMRKVYSVEHKLNKCPYLMIGIMGERLSAGYISDIYERLAKEENIKGVRLSPHTFRHTYAKSFLLNGGDLFSLQTILGHSDIGTTRKYVTLNDKELRIQAERFSPLENKKWGLF
jgi:site-specific recombinase XerD